MNGKEKYSATVKNYIILISNLVDISYLLVKDLDAQKNKLNIRSVNMSC